MSESGPSWAAEPRSSSSRGGTQPSSTSAPATGCHQSGRGGPGSDGSEGYVPFGRWRVRASTIVSSVGMAACSAATAAAVAVGARGDWGEDGGCSAEEAAAPLEEAA